MSSRRHSLGGPPPNTATESVQNLRQRVITCLNKLSDRDTLPGAVAELESIARTLSHDSFSSFLSCIHNTDSSSKSPVRKQCVHLLNILSCFHGEALSSFLPRMLATVLRRLRDTDSAVRSACVDAVAAMSSRITRLPFATAFLRPLMDALVQEQEANTQIGAALCLAAAVEAAPDPDKEALRRSALPRLAKLVKSDVCRARAALLVLIGSVITVGGASSRGAMSWLVPCLVEFLASEDWTVRKAAAEALSKVASVERDLASQHKVVCLDSLQNRRFDKIKVVRETMNRALEAWREVAEDTPTLIKSECDSVSGTDDDKGQSGTKSSPSVGSKSFKRVPANRSPPSGVSFMSSIKGEIFSKSNEKNSRMRTLHQNDHEKSSVDKLESLLSRSSYSNMSRDDAIKRCDLENSSPTTPYQNGVNSRTEIKRVLFSKMSDEKVKRFNGSRSRVVPYYGDGLDADVVDNGANDVYNAQDVEDFSLIREQLIQIENQQSNLLDVLQRFIGSSQSGMNSLESRVHGLEMALDEISYDMAVSSGRFSYTDVTDDTCCKLPGTDFLSSKFWKKTEGRNVTSKLSLGNIASTNCVHNATTNKDGDKEILTANNSRLQHGKGGYFVNQLAEVQSNFKGLHTYKMSKNRVQDAMTAQTGIASRYDGIHPATEARRNQNVRSSV